MPNLRTVALSAWLMTMLGLVATPLFASASTGASCRVGKHERVVVRAAGALVIDHHQTTEEGEGFSDEYRACVAAAGRWVDLGATYEPAGESGDSEYGFQLRGDFVAFVYEKATKYFHNDTKVEQYNLLTGRRTFVANYESEPVIAQRGESRHPEMVSNAAGELAWVLVTRNCIECSHADEAEHVILHNSSGTRVLASYPSDSGNPTKQVTDLNLAGNAVSWLHLGAAESAPLH
jgi:hypothetical protein